MFRDLSLEVLEEFAGAQSWVHGELAKAETRRFKLRTDPDALRRRKESASKYEHKRWQVVRADPAKRAAHNAKRMAAYYRKKERERCATEG